VQLDNKHCYKENKNFDQSQDTSRLVQILSKGLYKVEDKFFNIFDSQCNLLLGYKRD